MHRRVHVVLAFCTLILDLLFALPTYAQAPSPGAPATAPSATTAAADLDAGRPSRWSRSPMLKPLSCIHH